MGSASFKFRILGDLVRARFGDSGFKALEGRPTRFIVRLTIWLAAWPAGPASSRACSRVLAACGVQSILVQRAALYLDIASHIVHVKRRQNDAVTWIGTESWQEHLTS